MSHLFEWDPDKARANLRKHGVSFQEASTVFEDHFALTMDDTDHSFDDQRFLHLGVSDRSRVVVVCYADYGILIRIISARLASRSERRRYEEEAR